MLNEHFAFFFYIRNIRAEYSCKYSKKGGYLWMLLQGKFFTESNIRYLHTQRHINDIIIKINLNFSNSLGDKKKVSCLLVLCAER